MAKLNLWFSVVFRGRGTVKGSKGNIGKERVKTVIVTTKVI